MRHLVGESSLLHCRCRVATADDRDHALWRQVRQNLRDGVRAFGKIRHLEDTHRAIPDNGFRVIKNLAIFLDSLWSDVQHLPTVWNVFAAVDCPRIGVILEIVGNHLIDG